RADTKKEISKSSIYLKICGPSYKLHKYSFLRVFYDVTLTLKSLGICTLSADEIGRHSTLDRHWEVYRFLLDESREFPLASA
ncbi:unnamed protein product, partial [Brassica rapa]